jgi:hypothetical protein
MSNTLAIGAVTSALQQMLNTVGTPLPGDPPTDPDLADAHCTARSLDVTRQQGDKSNQLNLFLYQVKESATFRNMNMPDVHDGEGGQQPLSLDLHYVLTAYGANDEDVPGHRMLGRAMLMLHDRSTLTRDQIRLALPGNDLWQQVERVRIRPLPFGPEEMSKLWTGFGKPYRLSVCYEVSVLLIESTADKIAQLPVLSRGTPVSVTLSGVTKLVEPGASVDATLDSAYPTLDHFAGQNSCPAARLNETLTLFGAALGGSPLTVNFAHPLLATPNTVSISTPHSASQVDVLIPNDPVNWPAGIYTVTVDVPGTPYSHTTNALPVPLAPKFPKPTVTGTSAVAAVTVAVAPAVRPEQKVALIVDGRFIEPDVPGGGSPLTFTVPNPPASNPPGNPTYLRLRVDGIDSIVIADYTKSPPQFDASQGVVFP